MKDIYPSLSTLQSASLVPVDAQPDYEEITHPRIDGGSNAGYLLADAHVQAGRGEELAAIHAESGRSLTFRQLADESARLAKSLVRLGLKPGERVAYKTPNVPEVLIVMLAIWKAGGVMIPIPVNARPAEFHHFLEDGTPRFLFLHTRAGSLEEMQQAVAGTSVERIIPFSDDSVASSLASDDGDVQLPAISSDQAAFVWHTGGTTGRPKGCYHTHRRYLLGGFMFGEATGATYGQRWAAAAPVGHALGILHHTIFTLLHGATAVFIERFHDADNVLDTIEKHRITTMTALMASWAKMAELISAGRPRDTSSLTRCYAMWQSASSSEVFDFWRNRGVELLNNFGSTSFATWVLLPALGVETPRAALGRPLRGYRVEAVEVRDGAVRILPRGEIGRMAVKGLTGLTYWNLPELQQRDVINGWTVCDDLIRFDEEGNAHYFGRSDYMISTAGFKVAPVEVEQVLSRHPSVREVAVVPAPCPIRQEIVAAFIALHPGTAASDALKKELRDMVAAELSSYKAPRQIEFIEALPRDAVGKVQTRIVKDWAASPTAQPQPAPETKMSSMIPPVVEKSEEPLGFFNELSIGHRYTLGATTIGLEAALEFARTFDPFSFHVDEVAAKDSMFGGIIVSGLQTISAIHALSIRGGFLSEATILCGAGIDDMRFLRPVRPGDTLSVVAEVIELKPSPKSSEYGIARLQYWVSNDAGVVVLTFIDNHVVRIKKS